MKLNIKIMLIVALVFAAGCANAQKVVTKENGQEKYLILHVSKNVNKQQKRYFIVCYKGYAENGTNINGDCTIISDSFLNRKSVSTEIISISSMKLKSVVLLSIIELSKKDYETFSK